MHHSRYVLQSIVLALLAMMLVVLPGCATTGLKPAEMQSEMDRIPASKGRIYFYRLASIVGAAIQPNISLNGSVVGESKPGGFFYVDVEPGTHEATARTEVTAKVTVIVRGGEARHVRSSMGFGILVGRVELALVDPPQGQLEMSTLNFTGAKGEAGPAISPAPPSTASPSGADRPSQAKPVTLDDLDALLPKK